MNGMRPCPDCGNLIEIAARSCALCDWHDTSDPRERLEAAVDAGKVEPSAGWQMMAELERKNGHLHKRDDESPEAYRKRMREITRPLSEKITARFSGPNHTTRGAPSAAQTSAGIAASAGPVETPRKGIDDAMALLRAHVARLEAQGTPIGVAYEIAAETVIRQWTEGKP